MSEATPLLFVRSGTRGKTFKKIQGFTYTVELWQMLYSVRVYRTELCERSSLPGRRRRTARWKFEAVAQIVRLLDTIEAPGFIGAPESPVRRG